MTTYQFHVFNDKKVLIILSIVEAIVTYIVVLGSIQGIYYIGIHYF